MKENIKIIISGNCRSEYTFDDPDAAIELLFAYKDYKNLEKFVHDGKKAEEILDFDDFKDRNLKDRDLPGFCSG